MGYAVRDYVAGDEPSWLRCRASSFLGTAVPDRVAAKPQVRGVELVAVDGGVVVGILDVVVDGELATIDAVAVHPDHQHRGIGGALLSRGLSRARALGATTLDAWTLDDLPTSRWYRAMGFTESDHDRAGGGRVHVCRRFALELRSRAQLGRRGDDVHHRAVAQHRHRQR